MMLKNTLSILLITTALTSCTMSPGFTRPDFSAAEQWNTTLSPQGEHATQVNWQQFFESEELRLIIGTALENNKDLKTAALNIEEARATYRIERASLMPNINANGSATVSETSSNSGTPGVQTKTETYQANLGVASYELDLFGRVRSLKDSALNTYLATEEAQHVVRNALIAEVTNAYLQLLADEKLLSLTNKTLKAQQETYNLLERSLEKGVSTEQDVSRAATAVETARVNFYQYSRFVAQDKNALFLLLGLPQDEKVLPNTTLDNIKLKEEISVGIPSEVLLLRPDIRQAEYALMARNADIGAARAAFFPSITLTGSYGYASPKLGNLFTSSSYHAWSFLPTISLPIFQGGRNKANLDIANVRKEKAILAYEKAIQTAFKEVADELAARETLDQQLQAQRRLVAAAQKVYDISQARYNSGIDSFLGVLDAQRELYTHQQNEIEVERQRLANLVNLYKVLGGGTPDLTTDYSSLD